MTEKENAIAMWKKESKMNKVKIAIVNDNAREPDARGSANAVKFNCRNCKFLTVAKFKQLSCWYCKYAGSKLSNLKTCQYAECQAAKQDLARMVV